MVTFSLIQYIPLKKHKKNHKKNCDFVINLQLRAPKDKTYCFQDQGLNISLNKFFLWFNLFPVQMASELPCLLSCDRGQFRSSRLKSSWNFKKVACARTGIVTHSDGRSLGRHPSSRSSIITLLSQLSELLRHSLKSIKGSSRPTWRPGVSTKPLINATGAAALGCFVNKTCGSTQDV